jgi:hypothetical protein
MGIVTATAAVRVEFKVIAQETKNMEDFVFRLRGIKFGDVQHVREGKIRLKEMRFVPRAELIPMRGIRPEGPEAEEAQEGPPEKGGEVKKGGRAQEEKEYGRHGEVEEEENKASERKATFKFRYACPSGCGAIT